MAELYDIIESHKEMCAYYVKYGGIDMKCEINVQWDEEAGVWFATSEDVPGLVLESGSFDALLERVRAAVPELLDLNRRSESQMRLAFIPQRFERVAL